MISLDQARAHVLDRCPARGPAELPLVDALGTVLAESLLAGEPVPPFDNTAMDGFAVRAADVATASESRPVRLRVLATLAAGTALEGRVGAGETVRIMTGAPMPSGADAVVPVERSTRIAASADLGEQVDLHQAVGPGTHVRRAGDDIRTGSEVISAGTVLGPAHLGVAASIGRRTLVVVPPLRVGVLSTGDELVEGTARLLAGQIRESNRPMLLALTRRAGCESVDLGLVPDDDAVLEGALRRGAADCDVLISSGGVSMGDFDVVKMVLNRIADTTWMQIAIKPSKPFAFGLLGATPVFGLPGNPVSSMVSFELLARPALRQMMGHRRLERPRVEAVAGSDLRRQADGRVHYVRVRARWVDGNVVVHSVGGQGSHQLAASADANALAVLADGEGTGAGGRVEVLLLDELITDQP